MQITFKLKPEIKSQWLQALRSGKYAQGPDMLCSLKGGIPSSYCCLGVLAIEQSVPFEDKEGACKRFFLWSTEEWMPNFGDDENNSDEDDPGAYAGFPNFEWLGGLLVIEAPDMEDAHLRKKCGEMVARTLAKMNDRGQSFEEIAVYIENNL